MKKEVIVNIRSGTAAMISAEHTGSVPDIEILKQHPEEVNRMIGVTRLLADKGYRGTPVSQISSWFHERMEFKREPGSSSKDFRSVEELVYRIQEDMGIVMDAIQ